MASAQVDHMKLSLQHDMVVRDLQAAITEFWLVPKTSPVPQGGLDAGQLYQANVKEAGQGHKFGSPHVHVAMSAVEACEKSLPENSPAGSPEARAKEVLKMFVMAAENNVALIEETFKLFRCKEARSKDDQAETEQLVKVHYSFNPMADYFNVLEGTEYQDKFTISEVRRSMRLVMLKQGGKEGKGAAPRSELARKVEKHVRQHQG